MQAKISFAILKQHLVLILKLKLNVKIKIFNFMQLKSKQINY